MGFISDIIAISSIQKIKRGGVAKLSISQITGLLINLQEAGAKLSQEQSRQVYALFKKLRSCNTKMRMDLDGYMQQATEIIMRFDAIAPYEKYSGGNEIEYSFLMDDLRKQRREGYDKLCREQEDYAKEILQNTGLPIEPEDAKILSGVIMTNSLFGKDVALKYFDKLVARMTKKYDSLNLSWIFSYFIAILLRNDVITQEEHDEMQVNIADKQAEKFFSDKDKELKRK